MNGPRRAPRRTARAQRKQVAPLATASLVDDTLRHLRLDDTVRGMRAMRAFGLAAGPRILARCRAERLRGRILYIRVASAAWSQELHALRATILERMHQLDGGHVVDELRFAVGDVSAVPEWSPAEAPPAPKLRKPTTPAASVYEALSGVTDPELRDALAALLNRASKS